MESSNFLVPFPMAMQNEVEGSSKQVQDWYNSVDQNDLLESALSSMVSSPVASNAGENIVLRELIGRLGGICNSGEEVSPHSYMNGKNSSNNSCYTTPLNSPPKLNLTMMDHHHQIRGNLENLPFPGSHTSLGPIVHGKSMDNVYGYQEEKSSLSDQIPGWKNGVMIGQNDGNLRKRKSNSKGKSKDVVPSPTSSQEANAAGETAKRSKTDDNEKSKRAKNGNKDDEPLKDYIHVRARRGQATDAHSLAERVRREKISQRMKFLQDLVPGCNKVTGKAVMLDEIINYVQSLQQQVEFLSMKLATINPGMDVDIEALLSLKDMSQAHGPLLSGPLNSLSAFPFLFQCQQAPNLHAAIPNETVMPLLPTLIDAAIGRKHSIQVPLGNYSEVATQDSTIWEDDLQSIVFGQNQTHNLQSLIVTPPQMKIER